MKNKNIPGYLDNTTQGIADREVIENYYNMIEEIRKDAEKKLIQRLIRNIVDDELKELIKMACGRK